MGRGTLWFDASAAQTKFKTAERRGCLGASRYVAFSTVTYIIHSIDSTTREIEERCAHFREVRWTFLTCCKCNPRELPSVWKLPIHEHTDCLFISNYGAFGITEVCFTAAKNEIKSFPCYTLTAILSLGWTRDDGAMLYYRLGTTNKLKFAFLLVAYT